MDNNSQQTLSQAPPQNPAPVYFPDLKTHFTETWNLYKKKLLLLIIITLPNIIISLGASFLFPGLSTTSKEHQFQYILQVLPTFIPFLIISIVLYVFTQGAQIYTLINDSDITWQEAYKKTVSKFFSILGIDILYVLIMAGGFMFFIIPGIIWAVIYRYALFILLNENTGVNEAFSKSSSYVKGRWWKIVGRNIILIFIVIIISRVFSLPSAILPAGILRSGYSAIINAFMSLFSLTFSFLLYKYLKATSVATETNFPSKGMSAKKVILFIFLAFLSLFVLVFLIGFIRGFFNLH